MTEEAPAGPRRARPETEQASTSRRQFGVTLALLAGFAALVVAMIWTADGDANVWQRRLYVFGAVEALVFTAVGWLFGRESYRSAAASARADADAANSEAAEARAQAQQEASRAERADTTLNAIRAASQAVDRTDRDAITDVGADHDGASLDLRLFIEELLKPKPGR